jgi:hypothetical protein
MVELVTPETTVGDWLQSLARLGRSSANTRALEKATSRLIECNAALETATANVTDAANEVMRLSALVRAEGGSANEP